MNIENMTVPLSRLLLDPSNYRLDRGEGDQSVEDSEIVGLQDETRAKIEKERLGELRESILKNGFLEIDRIVVRPLQSGSENELFVVVEGNRRTAALKGLSDDYQAGAIDLTPSLVERMGRLSVVCIRDRGPKVTVQLLPGGWVSARLTA